MKKQYTATEIIAKREEIIVSLAQSWNLISKNNIFIKGEEKYDLKKVLKDIKEKEKELVKVKFIAQAINMGIRSMKDLPKNNIYETIYALQQVKERIAKLKMVKTKKSEQESVSLTQTFISARIIEAEKQVLKLTQKLEKFNEKTKFTM